MTGSISEILPNLLCSLLIKTYSCTEDSIVQNIDADDKITKKMCVLWPRYIIHISFISFIKLYTLKLGQMIVPH